MDDVIVKDRNQRELQRIFRVYPRLSEREDILTQVPAFVERLLDQIKQIGINVDSFEMDHVCYRVETIQEYHTVFNQLSNIAVLLIEQPVGGRPIATFKLHNGITIQNRIVYLVELPQPKPGSFYKSGWEHAEFVVDGDLETFASRYPNICWKRGGMSKSINQDISIDLDKSVDSRLTVKFHNSSLEKVIEYEKTHPRLVEG